MSAVAQDVVRAGREFVAEHRWESAYEQFSAADAERSLEPVDVERFAEAACWTKRYDEMLGLLERAEIGYEREGNTRGAARVAMKLAREHFQRNNGAVVGGWMARAAKLLEGQPECHETGLMLWMTGRALMLTDSDVAAALESSRELVELARRLGDPDLEALGLLDQGHALITSGRVQDGSPLLDEATALAMTGATQMETAGTVYCSTIFACRNIGDWQRAAQWTGESLRWCDRHSISGFPGLCRLHRAEIVRMHGSLLDAEEHAQEACDELAAWSPRWAGWAYHELGEVRRRRGDLEGARSAFAKALEVGFDPEPGLALLRLDEGDAQGALAAINRRMGERDAFTQEGRALLLPAQIRIALAAGAPDVARGALEELDEAAAQCDTSAVFASASIARGAVALAEGRAEDAVAPLRHGWRSLCELGARFDAAETRVLLGEAYRMTGDHAGALLELEGARETFTELGAALEQRRVEGVLAGMGGGAREMQTFVFTDIVDSTRLVELLGDDGWEDLLRWHDRTVRDCISEHNGREIKHEGDGFFVAFPDPRCALDCAIALQRTLVEHRSEHGFAPSVRIGIHATQATRRGGDFIGRGVHVAARVGAAGAAGEILATADTMAAGGVSYPDSAARSLQLKGIAEPIETVEVDWR